MRPAKTKNATISSRLVDAGGPASGREPFVATRTSSLSSSWRPLNAAELFARANARYSLSFTKYSCLGPELNRLRNDGDTIDEDVRNARVQRGRGGDNLYGSPFDWGNLTRLCQRPRRSQCAARIRAEPSVRRWRGVSVAQELRSDRQAVELFGRERRR